MSKRTGTVDYQSEMIKDEIHLYCTENGIELTEEQFNLAYDGVQSVISDALSEAINESVTNLI